MKKLWCIVLSAMLVFAVGAVSVFAADSNPARTSKTSASNSFCVRSDENHDGICDNYGAKDPSGKSTQNNGSGYCFIDTDKDGICDRYADGSRAGNGTGCGNRYGSSGFHRGHGR